MLPSCARYVHFSKAAHSAPFPRDGGCLRWLGSNAKGASLEPGAAVIPCTTLGIEKSPHSGCGRVGEDFHLKSLILNASIKLACHMFKYTVCVNITCCQAVLDMCISLKLLTPHLFQEMVVA